MAQPPMYPKSSSCNDPVDTTEKKQVKFKEEIAVDIDDNTVNLQVQAQQPHPTNASNNNPDDNASDGDEEEGINYDVHEDDEDKGEFVTVTRSGRYVCRPKYSVEAGSFSVSEKNYYESLADFDDFDEDEVACTAGSQVAYEIATVGAGVGGAGLGGAGKGLLCSISRRNGLWLDPLSSASAPGVRR